MTHSRLNELMHAVLDGEATAVEARELDAVLARDAKAKDEFDELRWLFDGLAAVPQRFPPEGLVAAVTARLGELPAARTDADQLFAPSGVFGASSKDVRGGTPGNKAAVDRVFPLWAFFRGDTMSESTSGFSGKRKLLIGGGIAVAAVAVAVSTGLFPPSTDTAGTIVPADRYRAPQITRGDVKLDDSDRPAASQTPERRDGRCAAAVGLTVPSGTLAERQPAERQLCNGNAGERRLPTAWQPLGQAATCQAGTLPSGNLPTRQLCQAGNSAKRQLCQAGTSAKRATLPSGQRCQAATCQAATSPSGAVVPSGDSADSGNLGLSRRHICSSGHVRVATWAERNSARAATCRGGKSGLRAATLADVATCSPSGDLGTSGARVRTVGTAESRHARHVRHTARRRHAEHSTATNGTSGPSAQSCTSAINK